MSPIVIYDSQFIKINDEQFIPVLCCGAFDSDVKSNLCIK